MLAAAAGVAVDLAAGALRQASPALEMALTAGTVRGKPQRALKIAAGRRMFAELGIVFLGQHQKPLSRERVGLIGQIAGPLCKAPVELDIHDVPSLNATRIALKYIDGSDVKAGEQGGPFAECSATSL
ncbi:hypothetical protein ACVWXO_001168 [Bradyrhizobium sp. LM2.7]